jgi:hypothetical protein
LKKNIPLILFLVILLASTVLKIMEVANYNFPFTTDQGRDMVDMRHMVVTHTPRLVGPTTSINGVLLGPFWYYFNLTPFIIGGGNPAFVVYWQILWYQLWLPLVGLKEHLLCLYLSSVAHAHGLPPDILERQFDGFHHSLFCCFLFSFALSPRTKI